MRLFVESLRRLYQAEPKRITIDKLNDFLASGKITQEEYNYIIG